MFFNFFPRAKREENSKKSRKHKVKTEERCAETSSTKVTAKDIMGTDSDADEDKKIGKKDELISYLCRRGPSGISKQFNSDIRGSRFADLKLYMCNEIQNISPMNRWRHAIVTLKTKIDDDNPAYRYLVKFLKEVKKNFKDCPITYVSSPNQ